MQLQRLLFEPTLLRSPLRVVQWWERRRLAYNAIVGATGVATLAWINLLELALGQGWFFPPRGLAREAAFAIAGYALVANVCYTVGPLVEMAVERWMRRPIYGLGPALFRYGLVFSIGLTALPAALITIANIFGRLLS